MATNEGMPSKVGQPCTVTSGPNAGKQGTYSEDDEGNLWCEGDWGGTQCDGDNCKDRERLTTVLDYTNSDGQHVYEVEGDFADDHGKPFHGKVVVDADTFEQLAAQTEALDPTPLSALDLGNPELDRAVTRALDRDSH